MIFECHKCEHDTKGGLIQNRVVQKGISLQGLEVHKTKTAGWGMRCFNEIPAGSFICTYEGEIMTSEQVAKALSRSSSLSLLQTVILAMT